MPVMPSSEDAAAHHVPARGVPASRRAFRPGRKAFLCGLLPALVLALGACAGAQTPSPDPDALRAVRIAAGAEGQLAFSSPEAVPRTPAFFALQPADWPADAGIPQPVVAVGEIVVDTTVRPIIHATRQHPGFDRLELHITERLEPLPGSKAAVEIVEVDGRFVTLSGGERAGVHEGDFYFVANRPGEVARRGDRIGALIRVTDVAEREATAAIWHADVPPEVGHIALFAHLEPDDNVMPVSILEAPFSEDGAHLGVGERVLNLVERFALTNIEVQQVDAWADPRRAGSDGRLVEALSREEAAVIVYGLRGDNGLLFATTVTDPLPRFSQLVGILNGGMPLPAADDRTLDGIALSALGAALAVRSEHATAAYVLEVVLRERAGQGLDLLDYHLREQLALRYAQMEQFTEAFALMNDDIAIGLEADDPWIWANAQSIRSSLFLELGDRAGWATDLLAYAEAARELEPEEHRWFNETMRARALSRLDDFPAADAALREAQARFPDDGEDASLYLLRIEQALFQELTGDTAGAILLLDTLTPIASALGPATHARHALLLAELYLGLEDRRRAMRAVSDAINLIEEVELAPARARVYERIGHLLRVLGNLEDAATAYERSARAFLAARDPHQAVEMLSAAGQMHIERLSSARGPEGAALLRDGLQHLALSGQLALRVGRNAHAAQALLATGLFDVRLGQLDRGFARLQEAWELSAGAADYATMAEVARAFADALRMSGQEGEASTWQAREALWRSLAEGALDPEPSRMEEGDPADPDAAAPSERRAARVR